MTRNVTKLDTWLAGLTGLAATDPHWDGYDNGSDQTSHDSLCVLAGQPGKAVKVQPLGHSGSLPSGEGSPRPV